MRRTVMVAKAEMIPILSLMGKLRWLFRMGPQGCRTQRSKVSMTENVP